MVRLIIEIVARERRKKYVYNVATLKKYGSRYKVTWNAVVRNKGISVDRVGKGQASDKKAECNIRRAKQAIKEYALCNEWEYFVTFTLDKSKQDRYDLKSYIKNLGTMIKSLNRSRKVPITYLLIPERHKDGAWHMHGFVNGLLDDDLEVAMTRNNKIVYHWIKYGEKFGFSDLEKIEDKEKASSYITKYVTKDMNRGVDEINAKTYYCSRNLKRAEIIKKGTVSAKYSPTFKHEVDGAVVYSEMWLPHNTTLDKAYAYVHDISKRDVWQDAIEKETGEVYKISLLLFL